MQNLHIMPITRKMLSYHVLRANHSGRITTKSILRSHIKCACSVWSWHAQFAFEILGDPNIVQWAVHVLNSLFMLTKGLIRCMMLPNDPSFQNLFTFTTLGILCNVASVIRLPVVHFRSFQYFSMFSVKLSKQDLPIYQGKKAHHGNIPI